MRSWLLSSLVVLAACSLGSVLSPARVSAQLSLPQALELLDASSADEVRMGIESLGLLGNPAAVEPLAARIRRGLPPDLLAPAVDTLGILGRNEAGPILYELLTHRRPEIRLRAVQAIATCRPRGADRALVATLSDSSREVREAAAAALSELHATSALDSLFLAFDHDVAAAGPAIATLARPEDVPRVLAYLGRVPFATLRPMLGTLIGRADLPQPRRLEVVARVGELATPDARALLDEASRALPANDPVRRAAIDTMSRIAE